MDACSKKTYKSLKDNILQKCIWKKNPVLIQKQFPFLAIFCVLYAVKTVFEQNISPPHSPHPAEKGELCVRPCF